MIANSINPNPSVNVNWDFLFSDSPWPMPHIIIPYSVYLNNHNFTATIIWIFLWESAEVLFLLFSGGSYLFFAGDPTKGFELIADSLLLDPLNGLIGLFIAWLHIRMFARPPGTDTYTAIPFWMTREKEWGIWPPLSLFGIDSGPTSRKWFYRKEYWKRYAQYLIIATPASVVFAITTENGVRVGNIVFLVFHGVFIPLFWIWNRNYGIHGYRYDMYYLVWWSTAIFFSAFHFISFTYFSFNAWIAAAIVIGLTLLAMASKRYFSCTNSSSNNTPLHETYNNNDNKL